MIDADEKVICVPLSDPIWNSLEKQWSSTLNSKRKNFQQYADLENKQVGRRGWEM
jgi:inorganic pyrophosphatase